MGTDMKKWPDSPTSPTSTESTLTTRSSTLPSTYDPEAAETPSRRSSWWKPLLLRSTSDNDGSPAIHLSEKEQQETISKVELTGLDTRTLEGSPNGFPRMATFLSSEDCFAQYRGFNYLHSRVLLDLQSNIAKLEKELNELDEIDDKTGAGRRRLRDRVFDQRSKRDPELGFRNRADVLNDIRIKLVEYDELLIKAQNIQSFQKPSQRDYRSARTWFWNVKPVVDGEAAFIKKKEDIVTLRKGREWSGFDGLVESMLIRLDCSLIRRIFCTDELRQKTSDQHIFYYSPSRVEMFVGLIITSVIFLLLVLPVVVMYQLSSLGLADQKSTFRVIGVLIVFTLLFSAALSVMTTAKRHELFAASSAYCAVLVVFITNFSTNYN